MGMKMSFLKAKFGVDFKVPNQFFETIEKSLKINRNPVWGLSLGSHRIFGVYLGSPINLGLSLSL